MHLSVLFLSNRSDHSALDCSSFLGTSQQTAYTDCGRCDNCTRDPESIVTKDVTFAAWIVVAAVQKNNIPLTALIQAVKSMDEWNTMAEPLHPKVVFNFIEFSLY